MLWRTVKFGAQLLHASRPQELNDDDDDDDSILIYLDIHKYILNYTPVDKHACW